MAPNRPCTLGTNKTIAAAERQVLRQRTPAQLHEASDGLHRRRFRAARWQQIHLPDSQEISRVSNQLPTSGALPRKRRMARATGINATSHGCGSKRLPRKVGLGVARCESAVFEHRVLANDAPFQLCSDAVSRIAHGLNSNPLGWARPWPSYTAVSGSRDTMELEEQQALVGLDKEAFYAPDLHSPGLPAPAQPMPGACCQPSRGRPLHVRCCAPDDREAEETTCTRPGWHGMKNVLICPLDSLPCHRA
eukprot:365274-Chlamydomonas_euryale.AAC.11